MIIKRVYEVNNVYGVIYYVRFENGRLVKLNRLNNEVKWFIAHAKVCHKTITKTGTTYYCYH